MSEQKYIQYVDTESGVFKKPEGDGWSDPFGDGIWRSSWFYSSLLIIHAKDATTYSFLTSEHEVDIELVGKFLTYFRDNCISDQGWSLPKNSEQDFSRDQLVPLLYLLETVVAYAPQFKDIGKDILKSLINLEENGRGVSDKAKGRLGRNIGYLIDVLCDDARYDLNYRTQDLSMHLIPCLGNLDCAKGNRRGAYKTLFSLALKAHELGGWLQRGGLDISDEYSVFNALAAVSLQRIAWGRDDSDVQEWRSNFKLHADDGWGPAFKLVSRGDASDFEMEQYRTAYVKREQDNDIIMAQRPRKIREGKYDLTLVGNKGEWLVLDYMILRALHLLWNNK